MSSSHMWLSWLACCVWYVNLQASGNLAELRGEVTRESFFPNFFWGEKIPDGLTFAFSIATLACVSISFMFLLEIVGSPIWCVVSTKISFGKTNKRRAFSPFSPHCTLSLPFISLLLFCLHEGRLLRFWSFRQVVLMHQVSLAHHYIWSKSSFLHEALEECAKPTAVPLDHSLSHLSILLCPPPLLLSCLLKRDSKQIKSIDSHFAQLKHLSYLLSPF